MDIFGKKKEGDIRKSPDFVKIAYDAQHRPLGVRSAAGPNIITPTSSDREWFEKKFVELNNSINSLKSEIAAISTKEGSPKDLVMFLSKWKEDFNRHLDEVMFRIKSLSQDSEITRELRHVDEGLNSLRKEIHADVIPKEEIVGRLIDMQNKINNMNQQIYQKLAGKYELSEEIVKSLKDILQTEKPEKKSGQKVKINRAIFDRITTDYLNIRDSEKVIVLTDKKMIKFGRILYESARMLNNQTLFVVMERRSRDAEEPDESVARLMKESDAVIIVTFYSLIHTNAVKEALRIGARVVSLARVPVVSFIEGGMTAEPKQVKTITEKMFDHFKNAKEIHVTSKNGTDVKFSVEDRQWFKNDGFARNMGEFATLPAGSVIIAPIESTINGKIIFDRMEPKTNIELTVEYGVIKKIKGEIRKTKEIFDKFGVKALTVSVFGIGCNPRAKMIGNISEDKKVFGNAYFGIGNNIILGGNVSVPFHTTGIVKNPTVFADGVAVIREGKFVE